MFIFRHIIVAHEVFGLDVTHPLLTLSKLDEKFMKRCDNCVMKWGPTTHTSFGKRT